MTNSELNEAVAKKLGVKLLDRSDPYPYIPDYCNSIQAAWEIVEGFLGTPFSLHLYYMTDKRYRCVLQPTDVQAEADIAPMAIALAFLKLP